MRKVFFKKFISHQYSKSENGIQKLVKGTGCYQSDFENEGLFHTWGSDYEQFENGVANYTVAIVELPDGTIEQIYPENLKFAV